MYALCYIDIFFRVWALKKNTDRMKVGENKPKYSLSYTANGI